MTPAAPTRSEADVIATDQATPLEDRGRAAGHEHSVHRTSDRLVIPAAAGEDGLRPRPARRKSPRCSTSSPRSTIGWRRSCRSAWTGAGGRRSSRRRGSTPATRRSTLPRALACSRELADRVGPFGRIVAVDLSPAMVERGAARARDIVQLEFLSATRLALPFEDGGFGAATIAFGLGALADPAAGLRELRRVVRPGGRVVCLEPTMPNARWWGRLQHRTARRLAPLAVSVAARRDAYHRLSALVRNVPDADSLATSCGRPGWSTFDIAVSGWGPSRSTRNGAARHRRASGAPSASGDGRHCVLAGSVVVGRLGSVGLSGSPAPFSAMAAPAVTVDPGRVRDRPAAAQGTPGAAAGSPRPASGSGGRPRDDSIVAIHSASPRCSASVTSASAASTPP